MLIKEIHGNTPILHTTYVADTAVLIGDVTCQKNVGIWYGAVIRGDAGEIEIQEGSNVQDNVVIHCDKGYQVSIGKNCSIGHGAIVHGCTIGNNVLVGMGATILNGAKIGDNCIIGANALVAENKVIPANSLVIGIPGKVIRTLSKEEIGNIENNAKMYIEHAKEELEAFDF